MNRYEQLVRSAIDAGEGLMQLGMNTVKKIKGLRGHTTMSYPGGKHNAKKEILAMMPPDTQVVASPFIGGGSVELALQARGVQVNAGDLLKPLAVYHQKMLQNPDKVADAALLHLPHMNREYFHQLKSGINNLRGFDEAGAWLALNKSSYGGLTLAGGYVPGHPSFHEKAINSLRNFSAPNLKVMWQGFQKTIRQNVNALFFADPPYDLIKEKNNLYGKVVKGEKGEKVERGTSHHGEFSHVDLARELDNVEKFVMTYNADSPLIRDLYPEGRTASKHVIIPLRFNYSMATLADGSKKKTNEIAITRGIFN